LEAFSDCFTNVVLNVIVLTWAVPALVNLPPDIVYYGRILPALGIALRSATSNYCLPCVAARQERGARWM